MDRQSDSESSIVQVSSMQKMLSSSIVESISKHAAQIQSAMSSPAIEVIARQQELITTQAASLQTALGTASILTKDLSIGISAKIAEAMKVPTLPSFDFAQEAINALHFCVPKFDFVTEAVRAMQIDIPQMNVISETARIMTDSVAKINEKVLSLAQQASQVTYGITEAFRSHISQLVKLMPPFDVSLLPQMNHMAEALEHMADFDRKNDVLKRFGWFYVAELPEEIVDAIYERKDDITQEEVDSLIVQHFRKNRCASLKEIVVSWHMLSYFEARKGVFHEALCCHSRRLFTSARDVMTIHFEGVVTDFVRLTLNNPLFKVKRAFKIVSEYALDMPMKVMHWADWIICQLVLQYLDNAFNDGFLPTNPDATPDTSHNKIRHGHATEKETEANSLRRFLYMNELYKLFCCMEDAVQPAV